MSLHLSAAIEQELKDLDEGNVELSKPRMKTYADALRDLINRSETYNRIAAGTSLSCITWEQWNALADIDGVSENRKLDIKKVLRRIYKRYDVKLPEKELPALSGSFESYIDELDRWITDMTIGNKSKWDYSVKPATAKSYGYQLSKLRASLLYTEHKGSDIQDISSVDIEHGYLSSATHGTATRKVALSMLKVIGKLRGCMWMELEKINLPDSGKVAPARPNQFISSSSLDKLVTCSPSLLHSTKVGERTQAMIAVIVGTLLSVDELRLLRFEDIGHKTITLRERPLGHNRLTIPTLLMKPIRLWVEQARNLFPDAPIDDSTALFFNPQPAKGKRLAPLSKASIHKLLSEAIENLLGYAKEAHDERTGVGIYNLRVSSARRMYAEGYDEERLHKMVKTRELADFLHVDKELRQRREQALDKLESFKQSELA